MFNLNMKCLYSSQYYYHREVQQYRVVFGLPLPSPTPRRAATSNWKHGIFSSPKLFLCSASRKCMSQTHGFQPGRGPTPQPQGHASDCTRLINQPIKNRRSFFSLAPVNDFTFRLVVPRGTGRSNFGKGGFYSRAVA